MPAPRTTSAPPATWWPPPAERVTAVDTERAKDDLRRDLQDGRDVLLWKLDRLSEYGGR